jgi:hypothetical protein
MFCKLLQWCHSAACLHICPWYLTLWQPSELGLQDFADLT